MRGVLSFKQFYPEWKGHWNYLVKDNHEVVNRSQTISFKRSNRVWPFIPEDEKQNYDIYTYCMRIANSSHHKYTRTTKHIFACAWCWDR